MGLTADGGERARTYPGGMKSSTLTTNLSASGLARAIAIGELSAVEAVDAHIARIEEVNPRLNAVVVQLFDDARIRAQQADRTPTGERGPLHGVPVTVKECFDVVGTPSTTGLTSRSGHCAQTDAPLVAGLRQGRGDRRGQDQCLSAAHVRRI
jgi:fatty acid amide hydrolase